MTFPRDRLEADVNAVMDNVIGWRRAIHEFPELSFHEHETSQLVYEALRSFGDLEVTRPTPTSVMARLIGTKPGKTLAIRADMDALPIQEATQLPFASKRPGVMHACGHDGHTAMLLGAAKVLCKYRHELSGEIRFLFQHAEELPPGGAEEMVAAGVMDGVDMVIGIHLESQREVGRVYICPGPVNAAPDMFKVKIIGKGGHAAYPHTTVDSVVVAAHTIVALQQVVSRQTDPIQPLVVSICQLSGGSAYNVIPSVVEFGGTVRSFDPVLRTQVPARMEQVIRAVAEAFGASYEFSYHMGYHPVINDAELTQRVRAILEATFGVQAVETYTPSMAGEDFSAYQQHAPGTFFIVGAGGPSSAPHHHPAFTIDERALSIGVRAFVSVAVHLLME